MDFSIISQSPKIREIVQQRVLQRGFHDSLFPGLLYRGEASYELFPGNLGDTMVFSQGGLIEPDLEPLVPGTEPDDVTYDLEQWSATVQQYARSIPTHMP